DRALSPSRLHLQMGPRAVRRCRDAGDDHVPRREGRAHHDDLPSNAVPRCRTSRLPCRRLERRVQQARPIRRTAQQGERTMKKFMAVFTGSPSSPEGQRWNALDENTRNARAQAGMKAWHDWAATHASNIVEGGGPLGKTKRTTSAGIADIRNNLGG